ncbi:DoxX family membrane protein [Ktedonosporobacter rubrisoli]|uniref:DoxX family membrane protein n=1 Tax=Ktedonosporobacter rubrisoli TaxID=2509675 RepID=A0A4P6JWX7_KTERU|nr:DoxX family protein [Ktedonosporobacter rubrisoli]QBD79985.1 DoxX family membrane protein [Ktedonosporobacter rubrisoli]
MDVPKTLSSQSVADIPPSPLTRFLFTDTYAAWVWLFVRLYVGYEWFTSGWSKLTGYSLKFTSFGQAEGGGSWIFSQHGSSAIKGFALGALKKSLGENPSVQDWYAGFLHQVVLPNPVVFSYIITFGELLVGIALILGILTGIAACFGCFMNLNYMLAGAVSINPILGGLGILLILAWRVAGYIGLDRFIVPLLGAPWTGSLYRRKQLKAQQVETQAAQN